MKKLLIGCCLIGILGALIGSTCAQTPLPTPSPPAQPQGILYSLPAGGWNLSASGDVWDTDGEESLSAWTPTGGVVNLVASSPVYGILRIVNGGLGVYSKEDNLTSSITLTAVDLATRSVNQTVLGNTFLNAVGSLSAESGHVFFLGSTTYSVSGSVFDWVPGQNPVLGPAVTDQTGTVSVSADLRSFVLNGSSFVGAGTYPQFYSDALGPQDFPSGNGVTPDNFRRVFVGESSVLYETIPAGSNPKEVKFWVPGGAAGIPIVATLGTVPEGWTVNYIAGDYGVRVQTDADETGWLKMTTEGLVLQSNDTFFRNLLTAYQIDPSAFPTISSGAVAGETGDFTFYADGQQYYVTTVPEPAAVTLLLGGIGVLVLGGMRRRFQIRS